MPLLDTLDSLVAPLGGDASTLMIDQKVDRCVTAAIDGTIDALLAADGKLLVGESRRAKHLHDLLSGVAPTISQNPAYIAGRLGSLADFLGLAAERCAPSEFETALRKDRLQPLLTILFEGATRNIDLVARLGETKESVCRKLRELKEVGAVAASKQGREVVNVLLPTARAFLMSEWNASGYADETIFDLDVFQGLNAAQALDPYGWESETAVMSTVPRLGLAELDPDDADGPYEYAEAA